MHLMHLIQIELLNLFQILIGYRKKYRSSHRINRSAAEEAPLITETVLNKAELISYGRRVLIKIQAIAATTNWSSLPFDKTSLEAISKRLEDDSDKPEKIFLEIFNKAKFLVEHQYKEYIQSSFYKRIVGSKGPFSELEICSMLENVQQQQQQQQQQQLVIGNKTLLWQKGSNVTEWLEVDKVPVFKEALEVIKSGGKAVGQDLTASEIDHLYRWVHYKQGSLQVVHGGLNTQNNTIRMLSFRLLYLIFRSHLRVEGKEGEDPYQFENEENTTAIDSPSLGISLTEFVSNARVELTVSLPPKQVSLVQ